MHLQNQVGSHLLWVYYDGTSRGSVSTRLSYRERQEELADLGTSFTSSHRGGWADSQEVTQKYRHLKEWCVSQRTQVAKTSPKSSERRCSKRETSGEHHRITTAVATKERIRGLDVHALTGYMYPLLSVERRQFPSRREGCTRLSNKHYHVTRNFNTTMNEFGNLGVSSCLFTPARLQPPLFPRTSGATKWAPHAPRPQS